MGRINFERTAAIPYQERTLKLDRMRQLLTRLAQPDAGMKIVHVAGTKGKGSTAAMIAGIVTAAGFRSGVFSSPHLERIEERFSVDGVPCTADELVALANRLRNVVRAMDEEAATEGDPSGGPTYFDVTTAMALLHFVERQVDMAVLEVGLGGRLDSTNVCLPAVSVITSISFDHMRQLGSSLAQIAREKAGIVKPGVPIVCGVTDPKPQSVIADVAREHGCRLIQLGRDYTFDYQRHATFHSVLAPQYSVPSSRYFASGLNFCYRIPGQEHTLNSVSLAMRGQHQAANAAVALATIAEMRHQGWCISENAIRTGLSRSWIPGRVEIFPGDPRIVLDSAHNPASARALVEALAEMPRPSRRTLVLSVSTDKDVPAIVRELAPHFERFIATQYQENPRAMSAENLAEHLHHEPSRLIPSTVTVCPTPVEAWNYVTQTSVADELISIAGSFYLAAEMRPNLLARAGQ
jgi:dihydrofolate synthase/folylpolyglutamate synthase